MKRFRAFYDDMQFIVEYHMNKVGLDARDEDGAVSTETAVLTAGLVAIAVAAGTILIGKMRSNANAIPDTTNIGGG